MELRWEEGKGVNKDPSFGSEVFGKVRRESEGVKKTSPLQFFPLLQNSRAEGDDLI